MKRWWMTATPCAMQGCHVMSWVCTVHRVLCSLFLLFHAVLLLVPDRFWGLHDPFDCETVLRTVIC